MLGLSSVESANVLKDELEDGLESAGVELQGKDGFEIERTLDAFKSNMAVTGDLFLTHLLNFLYYELI